MTVEKRMGVLLEHTGKIKRILKVFEQIYRHEQQFSGDDIISLATIVNKLKGKNLMVVEIGCWEGLSTAIIANEIKGKGKLFAVDHWKGNPGTLIEQKALLTDIYAYFQLNMKRLDVWDVINPMVMDSETAASICADGILDFVFIDANHIYPSIKKDIEIWLPKLKPDGILCGHDAEFYYSKLTDEEKNIVNVLIGEDYIRLGDGQETGVHPGVVKALHKCLDDKHLLLPRRIWYYKKE